MADTQVRDGIIPFVVPSIDTTCYTYYKIFGDLNRGPPLVVVHGGPGSAHEYMLPYSKLWTQFGIPVVFYDQIGCAASTHLRHKAGDKSFWTEGLFISELENLLDALQLRNGTEFDLLGHSWGGMLVASFASRRPRGLRRIILASALASTDLWKECLQFFRSKLSYEESQAVEDTLRMGEFENTSAAFKSAEASYLKYFWCRREPLPEELLEIRKHNAKDSTVRRSMYGPSVFVCNGSLDGWSCIPSLPRISVPTLVYNGEYDLAHDHANVPFFEHIPRVRWTTISGASHMMHVESDELQQRVLKMAGGFLREEGGSA